MTERAATEAVASALAARSNVPCAKQAAYEARRRKWTDGRFWDLSAPPAPPEPEPLLEDVTE